MDVQERYRNAVDAVLRDVTADPYVLAVVVCGSMANDVVWRKSDLDLVFVMQESKSEMKGVSLVYDDIPVHALMLSRSAFKRIVEGAVRSSFMHSFIVKGELAFTRDETLHALWEGRERIGERDRAVRLFGPTADVLAAIAKAEKWVEVKDDPLYAAFWVTKCLDSLATIETTLAGELAGREVLWHAQRLNPSFFACVYSGLMNGPKDRTSVLEAIAAVHAYLRVRRSEIAAPILDYLAEAGAPRSSREIDHYFSTHWQVEQGSFLCEWLAEEEVVQRIAVPARLTEKSRCDVEEAAYYYDPEHR